MRAVKKEDLHCVETLLIQAKKYRLGQDRQGFKVQNTQIETSVWGSAVIMSAEKRHQGILDVLMKFPFAENRVSLGFVLKEAASKGFVDIVQIFLNKWSFEDYTRTAAIRVATENNHPAVVALLQQTSR